MQTEESRYSRLHILLNTIDYCSYEVDFTNDEGKFIIDYIVNYKNIY